MFIYLQIFNANEDMNSEKNIVFPVEISAQIIRIKPKTWYGYNPENMSEDSHCQMRFEILGCQ